MTQDKYTNNWKQRFQEIQSLIPEADEFLKKSGFEGNQNNSELVASMLWADANNKDQLIFTTLHEIQKLCEAPDQFNEIEAVRGVEPFISGDELLTAFYCLWTLEWEDFKGIYVKLSTISSAYSPILSIKCRSKGSEIVVVPTDDSSAFAKCLGDSFFWETGLNR